MLNKAAILTAVFFLFCFWGFLIEPLFLLFCNMGQILIKSFDKDVLRVLLTK